MVRLTNFLKLRERKWYESPIARVNVSWGILIVLGISAFVWARNDALEQRKQQMKIRKEVKAQVEREILERENQASNEK